MFGASNHKLAILNASLSLPNERLLIAERQSITVVLWRYCKGISISRWALYCVADPSLAILYQLLQALHNVTQPRE